MSAGVVAAVDGASDQRVPTVSVVMPMRNAEHYVCDALRSVLVERTVAIEVVVVDDGSSDASRSLVESLKDPRVRVIEGPQRGFAASLNQGIRAAVGAFIMECDADDRYVPGRIAAQVDWLMSHDDYDAVCGLVTTIDGHGNVVSEPDPKEMGGGWQAISEELTDGRVRTHFCTYAFRRHVFDKVGLLREYFETGPDIDFQLRLGEQSRVAFVPAVWYLYRLHEQSITHTQAASRRVFFETTAYRLQQERRGGGVDSVARGDPPAAPCGSDPPSSAATQIQGMLIGRSWAELRRGRAFDAVRSAFRAALEAPFTGRGWISLIKLIARATMFRRR